MTAYPWYFLPTNPCCTTPCDPCSNPQADPSKQSDHLIYTGPNLPCTGIETNDTFTEVIEKIEEVICTLLSGITTTTTTTNNSTTTSTTTVAPEGLNTLFTKYDML